VSETRQEYEPVISGRVRYGDEFRHESDAVWQRVVGPVLGAEVPAETPSGWLFRRPISPRPDLSAYGKDQR